jgi:hypothetical protein
MRQRRTLALIAATTAAFAGVALVVAQSAQAATAAFTRTSSWSTGYEAKFTVTNNTSASISSWNVQFDLPAGTTISSFWDTDIVTSGQHVTATNKSYNGTLAAGAATSFGFIAAGTGDPTNCTINGASCGGGTVPPPTSTSSAPGAPGAPGVPGNVRVTATTNTSVALAWNTSTGTVTGYRVYEGTTVRATATTTSATISGLGACTGHTYTVRAYNSTGESGSSASVSATTTGCPTGGGGMAAAPYLFEGWGNPPAPSTVMNATGVKWFTMAFVLSGGGCTPAWDGNRALTGGIDATAISQIRAGGGDVIPSFGGYSGNKLGPNCSSPQALAGAYQQVINAYGLKAIDIDIENSDEFESDVVQDRILNALKIVKQNNPSIKTIITFGTTTTGPNWWGTRLINQSAALAANIDVFTIMPFDFGGGANMYQNTVNAAEGLKNALKTANGWSDDIAYRHMGISGMNGLSDQQELTTTAIWTQIRDWAAPRHLARFTFWAVNRDRGCPGGGVVSTCSGIAQSDWDFTRITASYTP